MNSIPFAATPPTSQPPHPPTHERADVTPDDAALKGGEERLGDVLFRHDSVEVVPVRLAGPVAALEAVRREVLAATRRPQVAGGVCAARRRMTTTTNKKKQTKKKKITVIMMMTTTAACRLKARADPLDESQDRRCPQLPLTLVLKAGDKGLGVG